MTKGKRFPKDDSYCAGWDWAGDALTHMQPDEIEDAASAVAYDLGEAVGDPEMANEGILDRLLSANP